ncbi:hypothetical protein RUM43_004584 [Polyplax serrata]|uniref:UNC93-like protein MFSD11 n=1 Tax=Polyplax serrata TaxID=468196 RepID=A0AAN8SCX6_POLSC
MSLTKWKKKDCYGLTEYIECNYAKQSLQTHSVWFQPENAGSAFGYLDKPSSSSILPRAFILSFLILKTWLLYVMSALIGFGAAIIWTGQGNYLILNSDKSTIGRNSGIFWAMLQCSMFFGNIFVYFQFQDKDLTLSNINVVFIVLGIVSALGIGFLCALRPPGVITDEVEQPTEKGALNALKNSFKLFTTKEMLLLLVTFFYTGIELSFFSGIYSTSIGFTKEFKDKAKSLVGLSGVFVGVGEVLGGLLFSVTGSKLSKWGRDPIVVTGFLVHLLSFFLIFVNLPNESPIGPTTGKAYINSNEYVALFCSFLLGLGDSCFNTQIYSMLGSIWSMNSAPAVAIFKFVQSVGAAASFYYGKSATLDIHLGILLVLCLIGTATFCIVEWMHRIKEKNEREISCSSLSSKTNVGFGSLAD